MQLLMLVAATAQCYRKGRVKAGLNEGATFGLGKEQFREVRGFIKVQVQNKKRFPSFPWTEIQLWQHSIPIASRHHPRRNLDLERQKERLELPESSELLCCSVQT